jgi:hypothetical protein
MLGAPGSSVFRSPTGGGSVPKSASLCAMAVGAGVDSRLYPYVAAPLDQQTCRRRFYARYSE